MGDVILAGPSVRAIRKKFPEAKIKLLVGIDNKVFMNAPFVDEVMVCDFKGRDRGFAGLLRVAGKLRVEDFDMVIDFQNNRKSHILSALTCAPKRYGYDNGKLSFLLNRKVKDTKFPMDPIAHQSKVLGLLGIYDVDKRLELWPSKEDEMWVDNFLSSHWIKDNTKLIALNIGSSPRWVTKLWPPEYFAEISNRLAKDFGFRVVLIGLETESLRIKEFLKHTKCKPINALGKTNMPRLAGVSSFGIGGTNAHMILEEAAPLPNHKVKANQHLIVFSARSNAGLQRYATELYNTIYTCDEDIADIALTLKQANLAKLEPLSAVRGSTVCV